MAALSLRRRPRQGRYPTTALAGSAVRIDPAGQPPDVKAAASQRLMLQAWQWESFRYYQTIGEIWFCAQFYSRALQQLRLFVGVKDKSGEIDEVDNNPAAMAILDDVQDPGGGRTGMLAAYGQLQWLIGEGYMLVTPSDDPSEPRNSWEFVSPSELQVWQGSYLLRQQSPGLPIRNIKYAEDPSKWDPTDPDTGIAYRYWRRSPQFSAQADAPMRGCLLLCDELERLTAAVRARAVSRLAGAGILKVPDEISQPPLEAVGDENPQEDIFLRDLINAAVNPISDPGTASAVVPMIVRGAAEYLKELQMLQIHNPEETYPEEGLRSECIRRIALSLDFPPEVLLGTADVNRWNAWQIDEQTWKVHLAPVARQFCENLTSSYFRPAARDEGIENWENLVVWFDAADVVNHPDRSKDAKDLYALGALSLETLREACGFDDDDAPDEQDRAERIGVATHDSSLAWFGIPAVRANIEPEPGVIEGAPQSGPAAPGAPAAPAQEPVKPVGGDTEKGPPAGATEPQKRPEDEGLTSAARVDVAAEFALDRCRELAGSRLRTKITRAPIEERCAACADLIRDVPSALVAAALGDQAPDGLPPARALVAGGAAAFEQKLIEWGADPERAARFAAAVEQHAARTLFDPAPPPVRMPPR